MNKAELIEEICNNAGLSKVDAKSALESILNAVMDSLKGGEPVALTGFGTFSVTRREARMGVNPATGKKMQIAAKNVVKFKVGKELKECVS
jgi:DNA-binding protein HU-beta